LSVSVGATEKRLSRSTLPWLRTSRRSMALNDRQADFLRTWFRVGRWLRSSCGEGVAVGIGPVVDPLTRYTDPWPVRFCSLASSLCFTVRAIHQHLISGPHPILLPASKSHSAPTRSLTAAL
jgi:hypothetical protein